MRQNIGIGIILLGLLLLSLNSCSHLSYYGHTIKGHLGITLHSQPIEEILTAPTPPPPELAAKLSTALAIRHFASEQLLLPNNNSYLNFVDLKRPFTTWNVVATEEFSLAPKQWCFLVVGCLNYIGYFSESAAQHQATQLYQQGYETHIKGAIAYSTLGWFDDPLLNTMLGGSDALLAEFIFHELAHQKLFVKDDTAFNEAFATAVAKIGVMRWLEMESGQQNLQDYLVFEQRYQEYISLLLETKKHLEILYQQKNLTISEKRLQKQIIFSKLQTDYTALSQRWGEKLFSSFFKTELNNAKFALLATYREWVPAFELLYVQQQRDLKKFYLACQHLAALPWQERQQQLQLLQKKQPHHQHFPFSAK